MCKTSQYVTSEGQNYVRVKKKKKHRTKILQSLCPCCS